MHPQEEGPAGGAYQPGGVAASDVFSSCRCLDVKTFWPS